MEVVVVKKNADFTEGRGPMLVDKIFDSMEAAEAYIAEQPGIYGSKQGKSRYGEWNGYSTTVMLVYGRENWKEIAEEQERQEALKKLTAREKELLGL